MLELSERIASDEFAKLARHPEHPEAFTRSRKLPLPALIAALLSMRNQSQQAMLDNFFASILDTAGPRREVSDRAFAKARDHLHLPALVSLNDLVVRRADEADLIERWHGLRVVAGDASVLMPALRNRSASGVLPDDKVYFHNGSIVNKDGERRCKRASGASAWMSTRGGGSLSVSTPVS